MERQLLQDLDKQPFDGDVHFNLGVFYKNRARWDKALMYFSQAITLKPDDGEAHFYAGWLSRFMNKLENGRFHLKKAVALMPNFADAWYELACVHSDLAERAEAIYCLEKSVQCCGQGDLENLANVQLLNISQYYAGILEIGSPRFDYWVEELEKSARVAKVKSEAAELKEQLLRLRALSE
jgi:tetratricopeptide (TPR) repeat protein